MLLVLCNLFVYIKAENNIILLFPSSIMLKFLLEG